MLGSCSTGKVLLLDCRRLESKGCRTPGTSDRLGREDAVQALSEYFDSGRSLKMLVRGTGSSLGCNWVLLGMGRSMRLADTGSLAAYLSLLPGQTICLHLFVEYK